MTDTKPSEAWLRKLLALEDSEPGAGLPVGDPTGTPMLPIEGAQFLRLNPAKLAGVPRVPGESHLPEAV